MKLKKAEIIGILIVDKPLRYLRVNIQKLYVTMPIIILYVFFNIT